MQAGKGAKLDIRSKVSYRLIPAVTIQIQTVPEGVVEPTLSTIQESAHHTHGVQQ
jgi:hypothetical protein